MTTYGPTSSPYGRNAALDRLVADIKHGTRKLDAATAEEAIKLVEKGDNSAGKITAEEAASLNDLFEVALKSGTAATPWGKELALNYAQLAQGRLFASQVNSQYTGTATWLNAMGSLWGAFNPAMAFGSSKPSYVDVDKVLSQGSMRDTTPAAQAAREKTIEEMAGRGKLLDLLKKYPSTITDAGHTYKAPTLRPDVEARYQALVEDLSKGVVKNEKDPMAPIRQWLKTHG